MSACSKKEALLAYVDRELAPGELELAEKHVAGCTSCQQQLQSIRASSLKVNALLSSLAPIDAASAESIAVIRIPIKATNPWMRWAAIVSVGAATATLVLLAMIRHTHTVTQSDAAKTVAPATAPAVETKKVIGTTIAKPDHAGRPKVPAKVRQFQALDDGAPIETGMIYQVSLPPPTSSDGSDSQSAKRIPAEVIVDEFGKVRAIRFLQ